MATRSELILPFKDQIAANAVRRQLRDLSSKISVTLQPVFVSKILQQDLKPTEIKPSIVKVSIALFIKLHVICVMQIMSPDTFINALLSTSIRLSVNTFWKRTMIKIFLMRTNFVLSKCPCDQKNHFLFSFRF